MDLDEEISNGQPANDGQLANAVQQSNVPDTIFFFEIKLTFFFFLVDQHDSNVGVNLDDWHSEIQHPTLIKFIEKKTYSYTTYQRNHKLQRTFFVFSLTTRCWIT